MLDRVSLANKVHPTVEAVPVGDTPAPLPGGTEMHASNVLTTSPPGVSSCHFGKRVDAHWWRDGVLDGGNRSGQARWISSAKTFRPHPSPALWMSSSATRICLRLASGSVCLAVHRPRIDFASFRG